MPKVPSHRHTSYEYRLEALEKEMRGVNSLLRKRQNPTISVYSADGEACIGHDHQKWHKIVCVYEGGICTGAPRPHWTSTWEIRPDGFGLESVVNERCEGWHGQYSKSELRYDELPRDVIKLHADAMRKHMKSLSLWFPCHIFDDINGELLRP